MKSLFLTGVTGMLGHFLLRDCLLSGQQITILARNQKLCSAQQRIDCMIANLEEAQQRYLPRPVVLAGNIHQPMLGLTPADCDWIRDNCDSILHSAASVKFFAEHGSQDSDLVNGDRKYYPENLEVEPYLSNVAGTKNLMGFCESTGIRNFYLVSTAYVCGEQAGIAREQAVDHELFGNDYEASKAESERLVRNASFLKTRTFLRPSIIIGDSQTGFSPSFHGIYTALQLGYLFLIGTLRSGFTELTPESIENVIKSHFVDQLGLSGNEHKNLVPADWVSEVIMRVVQNPELHGKTYHITNHDPVSVSTIISSMRDAILSSVKQETIAEKTGVPGELLELEGFRVLMDTYRSYFRNDPQFDCTNTQGIPSFNVCPDLNHDVLVNLWKHAIDAGFSSRKNPVLASNSLDVHQLLSRFLSRTKQESPPYSGNSEHFVMLQVNGSGGGSWSIQVERQEFGQITPVSFEFAAISSDNSHLILTNSKILETLLKEEISIEDAFCGGHLYVEHLDFSKAELESLAQQLFDSLRLAMRKEHNPVSGVSSQSSAEKEAAN